MVRAPGTRRLFVGELKGTDLVVPRTTPDAGGPTWPLDLAEVAPGLLRALRARVPPEVRAEPLRLPLLRPRRTTWTDGSVVSRFEVSRDRPARASIREARRSSSASGRAATTAAASTSATTATFTSPRATGPIRRPPDGKLDRAGLHGPALEHPAHRRRSRRGRPPYSIPADNPFLKTPGRPPRDLGVRLPQPLEDELRPRDRRPVGRRRRLGALGDDLPGRARGQLRLEHHGGPPAGAHRGQARARRRSCRRSSPIPTPRPPRSPAATSITARACPSCAGAYVYGDYQTGTVWGLRHDGKKVTWSQELARTPLHLVAFGEGNDGELYLVDHDRTHQIYRLVPNPGAKVASRLPPPAQPDRAVPLDEGSPAGPGRHPLSRQCPRSGPTARRPSGSWRCPGNGRIELDPKGNWQFPEGSVLARTVSIETREGQAGEPPPDRDPDPPPRGRVVASLHLCLERRPVGRRPGRRRRGRAGRSP